MKTDYLIKSSKGFSLIELLVVMALISILGSAGTLAFQEIRDSYGRMDVLTQFANDVSLARLKAVTEGGRGILVLNAADHSYSFGYDYLPYDIASPITYDSHILTSHQFTTKFPDEITITIKDTLIPPNDTPIIFDSKGKVINELGLLRNHAITFSKNGTVYKRATLSPGGALIFSNP